MTATLRHYTPAAGTADADTLPSRIPALDGLRGIAILLVMILHYEARYWPWRTGVMAPVFHVITFGWAGVDLFFVLSGFLITGILLDARRSESYFTTFYVRRTLRIFPLYYFALFLVFVLLHLVGGGAIGAPAVPASTQWWFWGYGANVLVAFRGWSASPPMTPHFWTLAIEEQFYLVWPAVVLLCDRKALLRVCVLCIAGAFALRVGFRFFTDQELAAYMLMPARLDSLAVGAFLAALVRGPHGLAPLRRLAVPAALVVGGGTFAVFAWRHFGDHSDRVIGTAGQLAVAIFFGTVILAAITAERGSVRLRLLGAAPLRFIGRYSYGMYVYHYIVLVVLRGLGLGVETLVAREGLVLGHALNIVLNTGLTVGVSFASWHLLEAQFLRLKERFPYGAPVAAAGEAPVGEAA